MPWPFLLFLSLTQFSGTYFTNKTHSSSLNVQCSWQPQFSVYNFYQCLLHPPEKKKKANDDSSKDVRWNHRLPLCCTIQATVDSECHMSFTRTSVPLTYGNEISETLKSLPSTSPFVTALFWLCCHESKMGDGWQGAFHCHFSCKSPDIIYSAHLPTVFPQKTPSTVQLSAVKMNSSCFSALMQCWQESLWYTWDYEISIRPVFFPFSFFFHPEASSLQTLGAVILRHPVTCVTLSWYDRCWTADALLGELAIFLQVKCRNV